MDSCLPVPPVATCLGTDRWLVMQWLVFNPFSLHFSIVAKMSLLKHTDLTAFLFFWHSGTLALSPERQSARMPKLKG